MLTKQDTQKIVEAVKEVVKPIHDKLTQHSLSFHAMDKRFADLEQKISHLPTKSEFYNKMGEVVTELQKTRDEQSSMTGTLSNHENRLEVTEDTLKIPQI